MRHLLSYALPRVVTAAAVMSLCALQFRAGGAPTIIRVSDETILTGVVPFGLNISAPEPYGANQILNNIIPNPGFEDGVYSMVFHSDEGATGRRIPQAFWDPAWNNDELDVGQPPGFWDGAEYEIVHGPAKGRHGKIERFTIENGKSVFYLDSDGPAPSKWDVIFVRRDRPGINSSDTADPTTTRPGSPGKQSLHLRYSPDWKPAFAHYADSVWRDSDPSAGKLFLVRGEWRLEFWAKSKAPGQQLLAVFKREGEADFLNKTFDLTAEWKKYEAAFSVLFTADTLKPYAAGAHHPILMFAFYLPQAGADVWVDDLALYRPAQNPTAFTDALVNRLNEFKPGVLRFWAEQFGDTLDNQLAEPFARRPHGYKPHSRQAWMYTYSLPEFLQLCRVVGAEPWYVIPPTFSPADLADLVAYLAAPPGDHPYADIRGRLGQPEPWTSVFDRIHLEYGNEMWGAASGGDPFMGASALGGDRLAEIASDRLGIVRAAPYFDPGKFNLIVGGQTFAPATQKALTRCRTADCIAFGPYFGLLDAYDTPENIYGPLFASPFFQIAAGPMRQNADILNSNSRKIASAIYEINFHTTDGPAPQDVRNSFVAGAAGAIGLPLSMLMYQRDLGITRQCAFTAAQYSFRAANGHNVRLWGLLRDLEATRRKRPTWLGLELVNGVVRGEEFKTYHEGGSPSWRQRCVNGIEQETEVGCIQSFAFRDGPTVSLVLFNLSLADPHEVQLVPSRAPAKTATHKWIAPARLDLTNEDQENISIEEAQLDNFAPNYPLTLPPHSIHVITWQQTP
ncbi:MAG: hypothetical protein NTZ09_09845 [Candidatus Hydrogenedentes bacterium]|nr:hypothetical protein [Candidatus Hydrogenedentota bacterium]